MSLARDKFKGEPDNCLNGIRHKGGANWIWASEWYMGTCRFDAKGETQVEDPQESEYRCKTQGRNDLVVAMKLL